MCVCLLIIEQIILYTRKRIYCVCKKIITLAFLNWFRLQDLREDLYYFFLNISYTVKRVKLVIETLIAKQIFCLENIHVLYHKTY